MLLFCNNLYSIFFAALLDLSKLTVDLIDLKLYTDKQIRRGGLEMFRDCTFDGNGNANFIRAQAGRFSYAYYTFFALKAGHSPDISDR